MHWQVLVNTTVNLISQKLGNFFTNVEIIGSTTESVLRGLHMVVGIR